MPIVIVSGWFKWISYDCIRDRFYSYLNKWIGEGERRKSFIRSSWWRYSISLESFSV